MGCVLATFKELVLTSFDEGFAAAIGLPRARMHYLLMGLTALAVVISIQAVGVVLRFGDADHAGGDGPAVHRPASRS